MTNKNSNTKRNTKILTTIVAAAVIIIVVILLARNGFDFSALSDSADTPLPTIQSSGQTTSQTDQPLKTQQPAASVQPTPAAAAEAASIDLSNFAGPYDVIYVLDGDTIIAEIDGDHVKIRLIGIDSPESVHYNEDENTAEGDLASDFAKSILENNRVWLEYDIEQYDQYGRTLAYVYTQQHGMVNDYILKSGYAQTVIFQPNVKYVDMFADSFEYAQDNNLGIWGR